MCFAFKYIKAKKEANKYKNLLTTVVQNLDDATLSKLVRKCTAYTTYTIDTKQLNAKNGIKTRQKEFLYLQELCVGQQALNQLELSTKKEIGENITSTFNEESKPVKELKKKENKA